MRWLPRGLVALGILMLIGAGASVWLRAGGGVAQATGIVIRVEAVDDADGTTVQCPVVRFRARGGAIVDITGENCAAPASFVVGEAVEIAYDPARPEAARLGGVLARNALAVTLTFMGILSAGIGVIAALLGPRDRR